VLLRKPHRPHVAETQEPHATIIANNPNWLLPIRAALTAGHTIVFDEATIYFGEFHSSSQRMWIVSNCKGGFQICCLIVVQNDGLHRSGISRRLADDGQTPIVNKLIHLWNILRYIAWVERT
jgi:hypothetical protein